MKKALFMFILLMYMFSICIASAADAPVSTDISYESRGVQVPATIVIPQGDGPYPLVVMIHGHGGDRHDAGFSTFAQALSMQGIASIRMDFPGCGDSTEDFSFNTESNMKQDIINGLKHASDNYPIDTSRVGAFGFSMGGRLTLELIVDEAYTFKSIALLAPAADTDNLELIFGGEANWDKLKKEAKSSKEGFTTYNLYGHEYHLSKQWFADIEKYKGNSLIRKAAEKYTGPALVIYAINDTVVDASVSQAVADALDTQVVVIPADGHNYGLFGDSEIILALTRTAVAAFFTYNLKTDTFIDASEKASAANGLYVRVKTPNREPLNFRVSDSPRAKLIDTIPNGTKVQITSYGTVWTQILYRGREGYVKSAYLDFTTSK